MTFFFKLIGVFLKASVFKTRPNSFYFYYYIKAFSIISLVDLLPQLCVLVAFLLFLSFDILLYK